MDNLDNYNQQLLSFVHPPDWINPQPQEQYDLVVIGAGTAGLVVAAGAAGLDIGLKVALIEKNLMGGDCLNFGCVPSKSLIRSARAIAEIQQAQTWGVDISEPIRVNFPAIMKRMQKIRAEMSFHDSAQRFRDLGIDVFFGEAQFLENHKIAVENITLNYRKAVIATGTKALNPRIPGLVTGEFLTNETIFELTELPPRLAIIGGGPIGCELAQTFQRFGSQVMLFHNHAYLLNKEDQDAAQIIKNVFETEKIQLFLETQIQFVEKVNDQQVIHYTRQGKTSSITADKILVGVGRSPNLENLNLEAVGVEYDLQKGVKVNNYLQTSNPHIYAAGDICLGWKFTHAADAAARIVIKNLFFSPWGLGRAKLSDLIMPWVTYTEPEIAQVGLNENSAQGLNRAFNTIKIPLNKVDRAIIDGQTEGFIKILHKSGSDKILGATIVANHAGEMISEITIAMANNVGLSQLSKVIHPYPTQADGIKKAGDAYQKTLLTTKAKLFLQFLSKLS